jgi:hypothetical protein
MFLKQFEKKEKEEKKTYLVENKCVDVNIHNVRTFDIDTLSNFWFYQSHSFCFVALKPTYIF